MIPAGGLPARRRNDEMTKLTAIDGGATKPSRPDIDDLIREAAKVPPGPEAWAPIFQHYPEIGVDAIIERFRLLARRAQREADELDHFARTRGFNPNPKE
jgi:hypothetical protein